jgi:hypothetical protein
MITLQAVQDHLGVWISQVQGKYINEDWEPVTQGYGAQCWDLAAHWSQSLGLPVINTGGKGRWPGWAGNMVDAFPQSPQIDAAYELIGPDQPGLTGDIPVWGDSYYWYPKTHVAVLVRDTRNGWLTCFSQNSVPSRGDNPYPNWTTGPTTLQTLPRQGLIGFIRPRTGGSIAPAGDITTQTQEDDVLQESDRQMFKEFMDDYFLNTPRFDQRTIFQNALRTRQELQDVSTQITKLPQTILFDTRVDGRNGFDWDKYNAALTIAGNSVKDGDDGVEGVDVDALADALAERLPQANAEALIDALAARLAGGK